MGKSKKATTGRRASFAHLLKTSLITCLTWGPHSLLKICPGRQTRFGLIVNHHKSVSDGFGQWPKAPRFRLVDIHEGGKNSRCLKHCLPWFDTMLRCLDSLLQ